MPAISIIIPVYNVEKYLRRCLDSVLNQTFQDWQAICVNDGSPDNSAAILDEYAKRDPRFVIVTKENAGDAYVVGRKYANGSIIMRLDAESCIQPHTLKIVSLLSERKGVISKITSQYLKRYLPVAAAVVERAVENNDKNDKIFTLWLQGEDKAPPLVKACHRSVRKHCKQELIVLDEKTVFDYITLPQVIIDKYKAGKIGHAHFADICRVELLYNHGGYWLDSTGFATAPIPKWISDQDFFVYMAGQKVGSPYSFMQNCFIRSRKGAYLLDAWRAMILDYWMHENGSFDYFMHQLLFKTLVENDERAKKYFAEMPHIDHDPTHALWWAYHKKPFDKKTFDDVTSGAFFQKTTYKQAKNPIPGSFADEMIKM